MFIFLRLLLAHFIADFPLQLTGIYNLKLKKAWGSFIHSGIVMLVCVVLCMPFLRKPEMWVIMFWIWIVHGLQDWGKVVYCERAKRDTLWIFILDQLMHIALISMVFIIPGLSSLVAPAGESIILRIYADNQIVICAMGYIFAGFGGVFVNLYVKAGFLKIPAMDVPRGIKKYYGIAERVLIVMLIILGGYWFLLIAPFLGARVLLARKKNKELYVELTINALIAIVISLPIRFIL